MAARDLPYTLVGGSGGTDLCVHIVFNDSTFPALVDTGSAVSLVNAGVLPASSSPSASAPLPALMTIDGSSLPLLGSVRLRVSLGQRCICHLFYVCQSLPIPFVLGCDFLTTHQVVIDVAQRQVNFDGMKLLATSTHLQPTVASAPVCDAQEVADAFPGVFPTKDDDWGRTSLVKHHIQLVDSIPVRRYPYRMPFSQRSQAREQVAEMLRKGVIRPSTSPWSSPYLLKEKKDGSWRFCIDFRELNRKTVSDSFPMPRIEDCLDALHGAKVFSTLDLQSGYWQVELEEDCKKYTAFAMDDNLYEFNVMPFGLKNAPATFCRLMQTVLRGLTPHKCLPYLDDIVVFGATQEEHDANLREVLEKIHRAGLKLNKKKCTFRCDRVNYLGHVISAGGVAADPMKLQAIQEVPTPKTVHEVRSFLGFANYYRRHIDHFADMSHPLTELTKKNHPFQWTETEETAFQNLKNALMSPPLLAFPDFNQEFVVQTDASGVALGAVLSQGQGPDERPIAFASKKLNEAERHYSATDLELLAVVWAITEAFYPYLYGRKFRLQTDHHPLVGLRHAKNPSHKHRRWLLRLEEFDFVIEYKKGHLNGNADFMSRMNHSQANLVAATRNDDGLSRDVKTAQGEDDQVKKITEYMQSGGDLELSPTRYQNFVLHNVAQFTVEANVLYFNGLIVVPTTLTSKVITSFHDVGHFNADKTLSAIRERFWWHGMVSEVRQFVKGCAHCAVTKSEGALRPPQRHLPNPGPFQFLAIDIVGELPSARGYRFILTMEDHFTKWVEAIPMTKITADAVATAVLKHWVFRYGPPVIIHSDRGPQFESDVFQLMCQAVGMEKSRTTPYHPQGDGVLERFHRTLKGRLSGTGCWVDHLPHAMFAYRVAKHSSTGYSPFQLVFGFQPSIPTDWPHEVTSSQGPSAEFIAQVNKGLREVRNKVFAHNSQQKPEQSRDLLQPGDSVYLRIPNPAKWTKPWRGPFRVIRLVNPAVAQLEVMGTQHLSNLKKVHAVAFTAEEEGEKMLKSD